MNSKVSIVLRVLAILLAAGAVTLFFLIKGEMDNAIVKAKPLAVAAQTSEDPFEYKNLAKPKDLREAMEIVAPAYKEIEGRREQKRKDDATISAQKSTIAERDQTITNLNAEIDSKNAENADLTRQKSELESKVSSLESELQTTKAELNSEKITTASLNQRIANMKTMEEYNELLDQISGLEKDKESGQNRYFKLRRMAITRELGIDENEFPAGLYDSSLPDDVPQPEFEKPYVMTSVISIDTERGLLAISGRFYTGSAYSGGEYRFPDSEGYYDVYIKSDSVPGEDMNIGRIKLVSQRGAVGLAHILSGATIPEKVRNGSELRLVPFVHKTPGASN